MKKEIKNTLIQIENITNRKVQFSKRNVPHIVFSCNNIKYSVCYFYNKNLIKVFYTYPSNNQKRINFKNIEEFNNFFQFIN